jgi:hypothetical integral membrane protein (TIGR02206 family)
MDQIFTKDFSSGPFVLFSPSHLIALGCCVLLLLFFILNRRRFSEIDKKHIRQAMAIILVLNEIAWHVWNAAVGQWNIQTMLPFHLCSVFVWIGAYMLVKKDARIYEFAYLLGIPGALQALLTPDLGIYDFPHFRYYQVFISHGLIIVSAIYMTVVEGFRPTRRSLVRVLVGANLYMLVITGINFLIGSNYLFTAHKPPTASLLDVLPAWPWYLPIIELLGWFFVGLMYLPFAIRDWRVNRKASATAPL